MNAMVALLWFASSMMDMAPSGNGMNSSVRRVEVLVDPRVEMLSIVFRVAGAREYQRGRVPTYAADVDAHFEPFSDHGAVEMVRLLRQRDRISHDAVIKLAVHVDDAKSWRETVPLDEAETLGKRWWPEAARALLKELRNFAEESRFDAFFERHKSLFSVTEERLEEQLAAADLVWLDDYFGVSSRALWVIAGMLTGRASYGATVSDGSKKDRYAIVGVDSVDESGLPRFDRSVIESIVHELCHSYLQPLLSKHAEALSDAGAVLYRSQESKMEAQMYRSGYTVMNETLTRACTNRYLQAKGLPEEVERDLSYNRSRGFVWIEEVSQLLARYESDRKRFPTFDDFAPELIRFFASYR